MTGRGYAGDVSPATAWEILNDDPEAILIDVRTEPEWRFVGVPDLSTVGKSTLLLSWQSYPTMEVNEAFATEVEDRGLDHDRPILLLCRSGVRSRHAAIELTQRGFRRCYNVSDGFEGAKDEDGRRGALGGWKASGLPWFQE